MNVRDNSNVTLICFSQRAEDATKGKKMSACKKVFVIMIIFVCSATLSYAQRRMESNKKSALEWLDNNTHTFTKAALTIHGYAETALNEYKSAELHVDLLKDNGFTVECGVAGIPTAFVASYGSGYPVVGIMAEYDALPGLSQVPTATQKKPVEPGKGGHGCGHNLLGTGSTAAAIAAKIIMEKNSLKGTIKLFGCPAEETLVGKIYMAKEGVFDGTDVCFYWHPSSKNHAGLPLTIAMNNFEVMFRGKTAHGAADPWNGRSALDAVELMNAGVNYLREHVKPTVRIHYMISHGGQAPNIVPDYAKAWYFVRDNTREGIEHVYKRVMKCAEGAALMTETDLEVNLITGTYAYLPNHELTRLLDRNLRMVGPPPFSAEDQAYAKEMQRNLGVEEKGFSTEIREYSDEEKRGGGSNDVADVSRLIPTSGELTIATNPQGIPGHSWAVASCSGSPGGLKGMMVAAKTIAASSIEVLMDTEIVEKAQAEFKERTKDLPYKSAVPVDQLPPLPGFCQK